jgi:hypothetical protein
VLVFALPVLTFTVTYYLMNELRRSGVHPIRRAAIVTVVRTPEGGFDVTDEYVAGGIPNPEGEESEEPEVVRE